MKRIFIALICLAGFFHFSFSQEPDADIRSLQKKINSLLVYPGHNSSQTILLDECYCRITEVEKNSGAGKYSMNFDFNFSEVSDLTYSRSNDGYQLTFLLDRPESKSVNLFLKTSDEKTIIDITQSLSAVIKRCDSK